MISPLRRLKDLSAFIMSTLLITLLEIAVMSLTKLWNLIISGLYYASAWYFTKHIKINYGLHHMYSSRTPNKFLVVVYFMYVYLCGRGHLVPSLMYPFNSFCFYPKVSFLQICTLHFQNQISDGH